MNKNRLIILSSFVLGMCGLFLILFGYYFYLGIVQNKAIVKRNNSSSVKPITTTQVDKCVPTGKFVNKTNIPFKGVLQVEEPGLLNFIKEEWENLPGLVELGGKIDKYSLAVSPDGTQVAYIVEISSSVYKESKTEVLYLYDNTSNKTLEIFRRNKSESDDTGHTTGLADVEFSPSGSELFYTTESAVYKYSIETKQTKEIITNYPYDINIYAYSSPMISPDNNYLLITFNYYEGGNQKLYNLKTNKFIDMEYGAYMTGPNVWGWLGNRILLQTIDSPTGGSDKFYLIDPTKPKIEEPLYTMDDKKGYRDVVIFNENIYFQSTGVEDSDYFACNYKNKPYNVQNQYVYLNILDTRTKDIKNILTIDYTSLVKNNIYPDTISKQIVLRVNGENMLVFLTEQNKEKVMYAISKGSVPIIYKLQF